MSKINKDKFDILFWVSLVLIIIYILVWLIGNIKIAGITLFPFFAGISSQLNYFILLSVFIFIQIAVVMIFYKLFTFVFKNIFKAKAKLEKFSYNIQAYIR